MTYCDNSGSVDYLKGLYGSLTCVVDGVGLHVGEEVIGEVLGDRLALILQSRLIQQIPVHMPRMTSLPLYSTESMPQQYEYHVICCAL